MSCTSRSAARTASGLAFIIDGGSENPNVKTLSASKPGFTFESAASVRIINPAPISRTSASAISAATSAPCVRWRVPLPPRPPSFKVPCRSRRAVLSAGVNPKKSPASNDSAAAKIKTRPSTPTSSARGSVAGSAPSIARVPVAASSTPSPPPIAASNVLSVKSCWTIRLCPAPRAARIENSCARLLARTSKRFATFTHAISSTKPTAPDSTNRNVCTFPSVHFRSGISAAPTPLSASG